MTDLIKSDVGTTPCSKIVHGCRRPRVQEAETASCHKLQKAHIGGVRLKMAGRKTADEVFPSRGVD